MGFINWWIFLIATACTVAAIIAGRSALRRKTHTLPKGRKKTLAHFDRLSALPSYKKVYSTYRRLIAALSIAVLISVLGALFLAARPAAITLEEPNISNRDIYLCLDVSGSMRDVDASLMKTFANLSKDLKDERIGLIFFNSSSVMKFPLTNDYTFVQEQLTQLSDLFDPSKSVLDFFDATAGTINGDGSSLIGDGIASCVLGFNDTEQERSRTIILATDNYVAGKQIVTTSEAAALAKKRGIRVYGINPSDFSYNDNYSTATEAKEFRNAVLATDGSYYKIDYRQVSDQSVVGKIVQQISAQDATRFKGEPQVVRNDIPAFFVFGTLAAISMLCFVGWRLGV